MNKCFIFSVLLATVLLACKKIKYYPNDPITNVHTHFLAHRAGAGGDDAMENTLEAAQKGLPKLDGIEVDIQISKNATIWLAHSSVLTSCDGSSSACFAETTDGRILTFDTCKSVLYKHCRLEDIFELMSSNYPDKYISIDVKAWEPCAFTSLGITGMMDLIGEQIIKLTNKYNMKGKVLVESETASFLTYVKDHSDGIECYLTTLGDFERGMQLALKAGYSGLSFKYKFKEEITKQHVDLLHNKGLKIQLWTLDDTSVIKEALLLVPDFIQTDSLNIRF